MFRKAILTLSCALTCALALGGVSTAGAREADDQVSALHRTVKFGDVDPSTVAGSKEIAFRIRIAASDVCGGESVLMRTSTTFQLCFADAVSKAAQTLDKPLVSAALGLPSRNRLLASR